MTVFSDRPGKGALKVLSILLMVLSFGHPAEAQDSVDLWGAKGEWAGKNADSFEGGYALGIAYVADIGLPVDLGADVLFARFHADQASDTIDEFQFSAVFRRWVLGRGSRVRPFLGARAGYSRLAADLADYQFEQNGAFLGPVLGFVLATGKTLSPMISLEAFRVKYSDTTLFLEDLELPQSGGYGWRFFARIGVTFGSGWERRGR